MAWYYGTYSCGHEGRVNIIGKVKDRQWKADRHFEKLCPECWEKHLEKERQRKNEEAARKAVEMELPELQGTEKQVTWANTLRVKLLEKLDEFAHDKENIDDFNLLYNCNLTTEDVLRIKDYIMRNKTSASYYIDSRYENIYKIIKAEMKEALKTEEEIAAEEIDKKAELEIKAESTVRPENSVSERAAEIRVKDDKISVIFEKNDIFRSIVKDLGYKWSGYAWERKINKFNGPAADRAAELGNKLLNAGFPICILDEEIRQMAVEGTFQPEQTRWVKLRVSGKYKDWLSISWKGRDDELYQKARSLPGSRWSSPDVVVKVDYYREVEDFANLYGFKLSDGAKRAIETYKKAQEKIETVKPVQVLLSEQKDGLKEILESSRDVLPDLLDEN